MSEPLPLTRLLRQWRDGDRAALDALMPHVYAELKRLARNQLRRESTEASTLQPTLLLHEAYLRLADGVAVDFQDRQHFLAIAARVMRQVLVDHARSRSAGKRDGGQRVTLSGLMASDPGHEVDLMTLSEALAQLEAIDERKARVVELRVFAGLDFAEIGALTGLSRATLDRDFRSARAWLYRVLQSSQGARE